MMLAKANEINQAIKQSEEYIRYQEALSAVKNCPELYQAMNSFRRRNYELQSYDDGINRYQEIHNLGLEYENTLRHPLVNGFLMAEQMLSRKMADMYEEIAEGLEMDYSYME